MSKHKKRRVETPEQKAARLPQRQAALKKARSQLPVHPKTKKPSGKARSLEKRNVLLRWVYEHGFISAATACTLLSVKSCDEFLAGEVEKGFLEIDVPRNHSHPEVPNVVYLLSSAGVRQVERTLEHEEDLLPYDKNSVRRGQYLHDNFVQQITLHLLEKNRPEDDRLETVFLRWMSEQKLLTDRRMASQGSPCRQHTGKKPDMVLRDYKRYSAKDGSVSGPADLWVELELSAKKGRALEHDFLSRYNGALRDYIDDEVLNPDFDENEPEDDESNPVYISQWQHWSPDLWIVTDSKATQKRYKKYIEDGHQYPLYRWDQSKKGLVLDKGQGHLPEDKWTQQYGTFSSDAAKCVTFHDLFDLVPATPLSKLTKKQSKSST